MYLLVAVLTWAPWGRRLAYRQGLRWCISAAVADGAAHGAWQLAQLLTETLLRGLIPFLVTLAGCLGLAQLVDINTWLRFALGCLFAAGLYVLILGLCLDASDRALIGNKLAGIRARLRGRRYAHGESRCRVLPSEMRKSKRAFIRPKPQPFPNRAPRYCRCQLCGSAAPNVSAKKR